MFGLTERRARSMKDSFNIEDFYGQLGSLREQLQELAASAGKSARWQYGRARDVATETAEEAEEAMRDNLAASLILALGSAAIFAIISPYRPHAWQNPCGAKESKADQNAPE